jgi:protein-S-isoprenylcysteine O-methyltransferase Ste14
LSEFLETRVLSSTAPGVFEKEDDMKRAFIGIRALIYVSGVVLLWAWVALRIRAFDQGALPAWTQVLGMMVMVTGGIFAILCVGSFVLRGNGTPAPFDAPRVLVAMGPYRYVRNPMYIGALGVIVGFGLYQRSLSILLFSVVWLFLAHLFVLFYEEPTLQRKFGEAYDEYCNAVPRWIPKQTRPAEAVGTARPPIT